VKRPCSILKSPKARSRRRSAEGIHEGRVARANESQIRGFHNDLQFFFPGVNFVLFRPSKFPQFGLPSSTLELEPILR